MSSRRWSLTRRLTLWFLLGTGLIVVTVAWVSDFYLRRTVGSELDALVESRILELRVRFQLQSEGDRKAELFEQLAEEIAARDEHRMAWRIWNRSWGWVEHEAGDHELLTQGYPLQEPRFETFALPSGIRWRTEQLQDGFDIGLVLDGSAQIDQIRQYEILASLLLAGGGAGGALLGWILLRRASNVLKRIADSARKVQEPIETVDVDVSGAPDEIRELVDALHELLGNIQSATERHRVLYASMAHELRGPIQNLVGATEVALLSRRDADAYRRVLESNLDELRELGDAIDNLMTICAPRSSELPSPPVAEEFDVVVEARLRLERERARAIRAGVKLEIETGGDSRMKGDRESVLRAVRNLVANAIEWSPREGEVHVEIVGTEGAVQITVDDCGPGVPLDQRARVFDPFYRGPAARGRRVGYGLGLAIVKDAADRHSGTIEIESSPKGGARFRLTLPRKGALKSAGSR